MHLNQRHISIRERDFAEILDLSLKVLRVHWWPLSLALGIGAAPFALGNHWLLRWPDGETIWGPHATDLMIQTLLLVLWEIPLATAPMTIYLGQVTFGRPTDPWNMIRNLAGSGLQIILLQAILRGILTMTMFGLLLPYIRWPYLNEIILLERNPLRAAANRPGTLRRSQSLHRNTHGELLRRWAWSTVVASVLVSALAVAIVSLTTELVGAPMSAAFVWNICTPIALWLVVGYFTIVRFLSYLDLRIRREGWELELSVRAEAERLLDGSN
jgi:hypothetical protein